MEDDGEIGGSRVHFPLQTGEKLANILRKRVVRQLGEQSTFPCTRMKHIADFLRNRANSQQYPSIQEDCRPKIIEDIGKISEAVNTRIPAGRGNPPTKEPPTDNNRRR